MVTLKSLMSNMTSSPAHMQFLLSALFPVYESHGLFFFGCLIIFFIFEKLAILRNLSVTGF